MSYDIELFARPGGRTLDVAALRAWFTGREHWTPFDGGADYADPDSGATWRVHWVEGDAPAPLVLSLRVAGTAPHLAAAELRDEVRALADRFELWIDDPQIEGVGRGELDDAKLVAGFEHYNRFATRALSVLLGNPFPPHLPAHEIEEIVGWNRARDALAESTDTFVPKIQFAHHDVNRASTLVAWHGGAALLPRVDVLVTPLRTVAWASLARELEEAPREEHALPCWRIDEALAERLMRRLRRVPRAPMPTLVEAGELRSSEMVVPLIELVNGTGCDDPEELEAVATHAHGTHQHRRAFQVARRLLTLKPDSYAGALITAANGLYLMELEAALTAVEGLVERSPNDRAARMVRGALLTELARYDEAVADCDVALAVREDAMTTNVRAYALDAAGRGEEARAGYERALELVATEMEGKSDTTDLRSRRAYALVGLGRAKEALREAKQVLDEVRDPFLTLQSIGRAELLIGRPKRALAPLRKARGLRETASLASFHLAMALAELGKSDLAREALSDALRSPHFARLAREDGRLAALVPSEVAR